MNIISIDPSNIAEHGVYCIKDKKKDGAKQKMQWLEKRFTEGLGMHIMFGEDGRQYGFIEYIPAEIAWRPVDAPGYMFIHCIMLDKAAKEKGNGGKLIKCAIDAAKVQDKNGVVVFASDGSWMVGRKVFECNGFEYLEKKDRYDLLYYPLKDAPQPKFIDWTKYLEKFQGWHLVYADQCPWHDKSVNDLQAYAKENGIDLQVKKLQQPEDMKTAPSGFGTYTLIKDGKVLADHYISRGRFKNILKKEVGS